MGPGGDGVLEEGGGAGVSRFTLSLLPRGFPAVGVGRAVAWLRPEERAPSTASTCVLYPR